jgi:hypothetical protein
MAQAHLTEQDMQAWHIRLADLSCTVRAAYPTTDDVLPGWTLLKDHKHKIAAMVRDESVLYIERTDAVVTVRDAVSGHG